MTDGTTRDLLRMIDANLNRAREALRVLEDANRFLADTGGPASAIKAMRADLGRIGEEFGSALLQARDTAGDTGTTLAGPREYQRGNLAALLNTNFSRAQEAFRSLEEAFKLSNHPDLAASIEGHRYTSYTLQQHSLAMLPVTRLQDCHVMVVLSRGQCTHHHPDVVLQQALDAGVRLFQLREKEGSDARRLEALRASLRTVRDLCEDAVVLINDRADFARALAADGVHLGQDDLPVAEARSVLGPLALIGRSTHNLDEVRAESEADYLGAGAMFETTTKAVQSIGGPAFGVQATNQAGKPVFAIGGVDVERAALLREAGVRRVAVSSIVCASEQPQAVCEALLSIFNR